MFSFPPPRVLPFLAPGKRTNCCLSSLRQLKAGLLRIRSRDGSDLKPVSCDGIPPGSRARLNLCFSHKRTRVKINIVDHSRQPSKESKPYVETIQVCLLSYGSQIEYFSPGSLYAVLCMRVFGPESAITHGCDHLRFIFLGPDEGPRRYRLMQHPVQRGFSFFS